VKIEGSHILITGAAHGIGRALAKHLSRSGANIAAVDISKNGLTEFEEKDTRVRPYPCDLGSSSNVINIVEQIYQDMGRIDVVINCAGIMHSEPVVRIGDNGFITHDFANWNQVISVNLNGVFFVTTCVLKKMVSERTKGLIVNFSSISAQGNAGQSAYAASKAGVEALTKSWAKEFGYLGIRSACLSPGFIDTPATHAALNEASIKSWAKKTPVKRLGTIAETISATQMIIENDFFNGRVLNLDGGLVI
jgi:3-oxoacyl-[acyl-carrier protein] reductase